MNMNYEDMSYFEINNRVAECLYGDESVSAINNSMHQVVNVFRGSDCSGCWCEFDPCNNPSDGWPIIDFNRISVVTVGGEWEAHWFSDAIKDEAFNTANPNPLRAAMICFLKMKDADK